MQEEGESESSAREMLALPSPWPFLQAWRRVHPHPPPPAASSPSTQSYLGPNSLGWRGCQASKLVSRPSVFLPLPKPLPSTPRPAFAGHSEWPPDASSVEPATTVCFSHSWVPSPDPEVLHTCPSLLVRLFMKSPHLGMEAAAPAMPRLAPPLPCPLPAALTPCTTQAGTRWICHAQLVAWLESKET